MLREEIKNYAAKWFDRGRDFGKAPITKDMMTELEGDGDQLLAHLKRKLEQMPVLSEEEMAIILEKSNLKPAEYPFAWYVMPEVAEAQKQQIISKLSEELE